MKLSHALAALFLLSWCATTHAAVQLPGLFSENAVLQQGLKVPVWGTGRDGEKVTIKFQRQTVSTVASNGQWHVKLKSLRAGGPFTLEVKGDNTITRTNILVGEVWVCSGQSNMTMGLGGCDNAAAAITNSTDPLLRLLTVPNDAEDEPQHTLNASWVAAAPNTVPGFSGVAYYFGRDLRAARKVPVGLIHTSWGGSPADTWLPRPYFEANPSLKPTLAQYEQAVASYPKQLEQYKQAEPALTKAYETAAAKAKADGQPAPRPPQPPPNPALFPHRPSALFNGMIAPLQPYAIRGAIWYQGESNVGRAENYRTLFPTLIRAWRETWGQGDFPFLFVQLAPCGNAVAPGGNSGWAELREAQSFTAQTVPQTGQAVITDVGECGNIHPRRKEAVGARLALAARGIAYRERVEFSSPVYQSLKVDGAKATLSFTHLGGGLLAKDGALKGFIIAGADRKFVPAQAEIHGQQVIVSSPDVPQPVAVRFGWADCPDVNLFSHDGLPVAPFRTDGPALVQTK